VSLTARRARVQVIVPQTWPGRVMAQLMRARQRVGPMAGSARDQAAHRIVDARSWAAPRLDRAAHSVEAELAPRVSSMLSEAARRVDPTPVKPRRWPMMVLISGLALGVAGYAMYRRNAQQWTDTMKGTAADASQWVGDKAGRASDKIAGKADAAGRSADQTAEDISKKMS
jgi:hypothetical protein